METHINAQGAGESSQGAQQASAASMDFSPLHSPLPWQWHRDLSSVPRRDAVSFHLKDMENIECVNILYICSCHMNVIKWFLFGQHHVCMVFVYTLS